MSGMGWAYLKFASASLASAVAGAQFVHMIYQPLKVRCDFEYHGAWWRFTMKTVTDTSLLL